MRGLDSWRLEKPLPCTEHPGDPCVNQLVSCEQTIMPRLFCAGKGKKPEGLWHTRFLYSLGAGIAAGATWQRGEAHALLRAGTVRLSRECRKEEKVLLCGCLHRITSATTTKPNNYFNCKVWKQSRSFRLQSIFQVFALLLVCNYLGLWSPKSEDVRDLIVFPLAPWYWLHYHGERKWQSTADAQHPWWIWCSTG